MFFGKLVHMLHRFYTKFLSKTFVRIYPTNDLSKSAYVLFLSKGNEKVKREANVTFYRVDHHVTHRLTYTPQIVFPKLSESNKLFRSIQVCMYSSIL